MPTTKPRHMITETPAIAAALDRAALRWPGVPRGQLVARLIEEADRDNEQRAADRREHIRLVLENLDPALRGLGGAEQLRERRETDWPE